MFKTTSLLSFIKENLLKYVYIFYELCLNPQTLI